MKRKTITKRLVAFFLTVCMVSATCFVDSKIKANAEDTAITELALSDLGIAAGEYSNASGSREQGFLDTLVSFYATPSVAGARMHFGAWSETGREGICLLFDDSSVILGEDEAYLGDTSKKIAFTRNQIAATDFGFDTFVGNRVLYQLKTEKVALDTDAVMNDIKFTVSINGQKALELEAKDQIEKLGNYVYFCDGSFSLSDSEDVFLEDSREAGWESFTLKDFNVGPGPLNQVGAETVNYGGTLDQTLFQAKINFPAESTDYLFWGATDWNGILIRSTGTAPEFFIQSEYVGGETITIDPARVSVPLIGNPSLELTISTEFTAENVLKLGIWFNGILYNGEYYTISGVNQTEFVRHLHTPQALPNSYTGTSFKTPVQFSKSNESSYTKLTLRDFGIDNGAITVGENTALAGTIDKTVFRAKMNFTEAMSGNLYLGGSGYNGIAITSDGTNIFLYVISGDETKGQWAIEPSIAGMTLCGTDELEFAISMEFIESDGTNAKLKLGAWLNGELYDGRYLTSDTVAVADFTRNMHGQGLTGKLVGTSIIEKKYLKDSTEAKFDKYTLDDFDIDDGGLDVIGSTTKNLGGTIDKTLFQAKMYFPSSGFNNVYWGGTEWNGIAFAGNGTGLTMYVVGTGAYGEKTLTSEAAGVTICDNESLNFAISAEFINKNGEKADLKIGLWFNGVLYDGEYWIVENVTTSEFPIHLHSELTIPATLRGYSILETVLLQDAPEAEYEKYTLIDFGYGDGSLDTMADRTPDYGTIDKTLFRAKMNFPKASFGNLIWGGVGWYGINILTYGEDLIIQPVGSNGSSDEFTIETAVIGEDILWGNDNLEFAISTEFMEPSDTDTKLKIGVWFNGKLYKGKYFTTAKRYPLSDMALNLHAPQENNISADLKGYSISRVQILDETKYTHYTLSDIGIPDGKGGVFGRFAKADWSGSDYDKVLLEAEVTFVNEGGRIHYATPVGTEFDGVQIRLQEESLIVEDYNSDLAGTMQYNTMMIAPAQFGFDTFKNQTITLKLTTDVVSKNGEEKNDVQLGIWINDKLANNRYCFINDQLSKFGGCMNFSQDTEIVRYSLWDLETPTGAMIQYVQLKGDAPYLVEADTLTGNDNNYQNGDEVSEPGDYKALYEADGRTAAAEKEVVLWRSYDVHADGRYDSRDLIAIKKVKSGTYPGSKAGLKAALHMSPSNALNDIRAHLIDNGTIESKEIPELYYQVDGEGKVMPISSWVTPALWLGYTVDANGNYVNDYTQYGVETNFLQDKYYEMIQDLGINHIVYQEKNYAESNEYQILKGLELAEKFNINFYVHDTGISDAETNKDVLAERLKQYSRYSSFAGIHVTDEPRTDYFNATATGVKTLEEIANKTTLLNSYSNLTGFINLSTSTEYETYTRFIEEYIQTCNPQVLSFDSYPFTPGNDQKHFINALNLIRTEALEHNIPFTGCVGTSTTTWNTAPNNDTNAVTQEQANWTVNTLLAFGAKGYTWFTLVQPRGFAQVGSEGTLTGMDYDRAGLIGADGSKTPVYDIAKNINSWTAIVDAVLMESKSVAILADGDAHLKEIGSGTSYGDMQFSLTDPTNCSSCMDGVIVGVFDYDGKTAYYVTNYDSNHSRGVKLTFDNAKAMTIYNQNTMQVSYEDNQTEREFNLPAGGAVLVIAE